MATAKKTAKKKAAPKSKPPVKKSAPKKKTPPAKKKEVASTSKPAGTKKSSASKSSLNPLGKKFTCHTCGTKFYDLNKEVKICPKCGADQSKRPPSKSRSRAARVEEEEFPEENLDYDSEVGFEEEEGGIVEEPLEDEEDEEEEEE
ncbi:TIGR02300 family protein [Leptospira selangorensis]|uniref:TIGR02300 family protein n=1 Tax=Leptospira selangorensis TaxID=2484982 RepID=A0A4R9FPH8_9LEPT|nr:TIGR02300 family protein [Leptospira selangorensis]TGK00431.1 TIGR02300 family protein [Leptospira selangorensis]TGM17044.1 TIGR02300 family protein [Leptospira selangorensis]TGM21382.1 TIGR02300 family protein [Leptospira selangorensis]